MQQKDSSNNSNADEYFQNIGLKKVDIIGNYPDYSDSHEQEQYNEHDQSQSHSSNQSQYKAGGANHHRGNVKRNNYSKQISILLKQEQNESGQQDQKTKLIKKNCVSAKMSRQRKKIYIDLLQKKVGSLKRNIIHTRERLMSNRSKIMHYIQESNKEKRVYIEEKMKDSKRLIYMSEEFSALSQSAKGIMQSAAELKKKSQMGSVVYIPQYHAANNSGKPENLQPNQIPPQMQIANSSHNHSDSQLHAPQQQSRGFLHTSSKELPNNRKSKKSILKNAKPAQLQPEYILKQLEQKKELLELGINSYLYKFGINGILKNDVVELLKEKWYELVIDESVLNDGKSSALQKVICDFRDCFWQIDQSNKKLDYLLRQLRDKIKPEYVVKFILQKQFFKSFSTNQQHHQQNQQQSQNQSSNANIMEQQDQNNNKGNNMEYVNNMSNNNLNNTNNNNDHNFHKSQNNINPNPNPNPNPSFKSSRFPRSAGSTSNLHQLNQLNNNSRNNNKFVDDDSDSMMKQQNQNDNGSDGQVANDIYDIGDCMNKNQTSKISSKSNEHNVVVDAANSQQTKRKALAKQQNYCCNQANSNPNSNLLNDVSGDSFSYDYPVTRGNGRKSKQAVQKQQQQSIQMPVKHEQNISLPYVQQKYNQINQYKSQTNLFGNCDVEQQDQFGLNRSQM